MSRYFPRSRFRQYGTLGNTLSCLTTKAADFAPGPDNARLEAAFLRRFGAGHALCLPQARVGIYLTIAELIRRNPGKTRVILSPYTIHDVINMVIVAGGEPVFADNDLATCNISAEAVESLISEDTATVLVTHIHGVACNVERIAAICRTHGVPLIEDCAQALGARIGGKPVGTFGLAGIFSFGMAKNVNSLFGGMMICAEDGFARAIAERMADWPAFSRERLMQRARFCAFGGVVTSPLVYGFSAYWIFRHGYLHGVEALNQRWRGEDDPRLKTAIPDDYLTRMTGLQARMILRQLAAVDVDAERRLALARLYHEGLRDIPELVIPPLADDGSQVYLSYPIQPPDRDALLRYLTRRCRDLTVQHIGNGADYPCFARWHRDCPNARENGRRVLLLPTYPDYGLADARANVAEIRRFFGR